MAPAKSRWNTRPKTRLAAPISASACRHPGATCAAAVGCPSVAEGGTAGSIWLRSQLGNSAISSRRRRDRSEVAPGGKVMLGSSRPCRIGSSFTLADPSDDQRAKTGCHGERQSLPCRDKDPEPWVQRVQIGDRTSRRQAETIDQRRRFKAPVALERARPGTDFASPEVKDTVTALACSAHYLPVHEVVGGERPRRGHSPTVKRQDLIPKIEIEHRGDGISITGHRNDIGGIGKFLAQNPKIRFGEYGRTEIMDTLGVDAMKLIDAVIDLRPQSVLDALAHHGALFARDRFQIAFDRGIERPAKVDVKVRFVQPIPPAR